MLLRVVIGHEHDRVRQDGTRDASGEAFPEAEPAALVPVDVKAALDHSAIGDKWMVLVELEWNLAHLKFSLDDVLGVGYEPSEKAANSSCYQLRDNPQLMGVLQAINPHEKLFGFIVSSKLPSVTRGLTGQS